MRSAIPYWRSSLTALLCLAALSLAPVSRSPADFDPPGNPPLRVGAHVIDVTLWYDQDDGADGNAELLLAYDFVHFGHGAKVGSFYESGLNWDVTSRWQVNRLVWLHEECTPRSPMAMGLALSEIDTDQVDVLIAELSTTVAGALIGFVTGPVGGAIADLLGDLLVAAIKQNGHDFLGSTGVVVPPSGMVSASFGSSALVRVLGTTNPLPPSPVCDPPAPPPVGQSPGERTDSIFTPLEGAREKAGEIAPEPGNPGGLNESQIEDLRDSYLSLTLTMAEALAASEIEDARELDGLAHAIEAFETAQAFAAAGDATTALEIFRESFFEAAAARDDEVPGPDHRLPFQLTLAPERYSTVAGRDAAFLMMVLGATDPVVLSVTGVPDGCCSSLSIKQPTPGAPVYLLEIDLAPDAPPGVHEIVLTADDGQQSATQTLRLGVRSACPGDTNGDREVNVDDLVNVILDWPDCCLYGGDLDANGVADVDDLIKVILGWGTCEAADPSGACCFDDGSCAELTATGCDALGGAWHGALTDCTMVTCTPFGVCCFPDGSCDSLHTDTCIAIGGAWIGPHPEYDCALQPCQPIANDACAGAVEIDGEVTFFNTFDATTDGPSDPACYAFGSDQIAQDVWFTWTAPADGIAVVETCGTTDVDTRLAAYDASACPPGPILACNDDDCGLQSRIMFDVSAGSAYLLRVGIYPGAGGGTGLLLVDVWPALGACCVPDDSCQQVPYDDCAAVGGVYHGTDTTCDPDPCTPPAASG